MLTNMNLPFLNSFFILLCCFNCLTCKALNFIPEDYDRDLRPGFMDGVTDKIFFGVHIYKIGPLSESDMSMTADIYLRAFWTDKRLVPVANALFNRTKGLGKTATVNLKGAYAEAIWRPNIYFVDSMLENTPSEISQSAITIVTREGEVKASNRVVLKTRCALNLKQFPLDKQMCPICFSSYEYKDSEQLIAWEKQAMNIDKNLNSTATFDIEPHLVQETIVQQWGPDIFYTKLCVNVEFKRKFKIYIVTMFLPSISLVGLSWVSFWIDKKAVPARAGLTITTILAQITLITGTANKFPGVADLKIGDIYMIVNFFFVFGSLIEFAIVNNTKPEDSAKKQIIKSEEQVKLLFDSVKTTTHNAGTSPQVTSFGMNSNGVNSTDCGGGGSAKVDGGGDDAPNKGKSCSPEKKMGFFARLVIKRDVDDIAKLFFPSSFVVWHIVFALMGYYAMES